MKKSVLFLISVFTVAISFAQGELSFGVKAGVNFASIGGDFTDNYGGRTGYHVGVLAEIPLVGKLSFQPELLYSQQGSKNNTTHTDGPSIETRLDYINMPLLAEYNIIKGLSIMAGPQLGILVSAENEIRGSGFEGEFFHAVEGIDDKISKLDLGIGIGAEYKLPFGVFFQMRYVFGLSNVNDKSSNMVLGYSYLDNVKNQNNVFQISAGYTF